MGKDTAVSVVVTTIDDYVAENKIERIDLIKIDVEGFEQDVLRGGMKTIERLKLAVFLEFNSFTIISFRNMNPRDLLQTIRETFPFVYERRDGKLRRIENDSDAIGFIHHNLIESGCVSDLYCSFSRL